MLLHVYVCDGPTCGKGVNGQRVVAELDPFRAQSGEPNYFPPDVLFKFMKSEPMYEEPRPGVQNSAVQPKLFCSPGCQKDFYSESRYTPPRSPRELQLIAENNRKVEESRKAAVDGFGKPVEEKKTKVLQWPKSSIEPAAAEPETSE